jgi:hypothetical protein
VAILLALLFLQNGDLTDLDREVLKTLKETRAAGSLVLHYSADQVTKEQVDAAAKTNAASFAKLQDLLKMQYKGSIHLFLYPGADELKQATRQEAPAFSNGTRSIHQPHDFSNVHEMCHIFALQFPRGPASTEPETFFVEGLATILDRTDAGADIDSWVFVYDQLGQIQDLVSYRRTWPKGTFPSVHPYYIPASFTGFLIDRFGIEKVKAFYVDCLEAHKAFGRPFGELAQECARRDRKAEVHDERRARRPAALGLPPTRPLPKAMAEGKGRRLFDGKSMQGWKAADAAKWTVSSSLLVGTHDGPWTYLDSPKVEKGPVAVRARLRLVKGDALQIRLNRNENGSNEAVLTIQRTFLTQKGGAQVLAWSPLKLEPGRWMDLVFESRAGRGRLYLNGRLELETDKFSEDDGGIGIGVERGTIEIESTETVTPTD